jgi:hypothetical protein
MFGFGTRKRYNSKVDTILRNDFQIVTDSVANPRFPGVLKYLEHIDNVYYAKGSAEAAASDLALMYYAGLIKKGTDSDRKEAETKLRRMQELMSKYLANGLIEQGHFDHASMSIEELTGKRL